MPREIQRDHVRGQFSKDVASYHISGDPTKVPAPGTISDADLERVYVVEDDGRQIMHVTYGSALQPADLGSGGYDGPGGGAIHLDAGSLTIDGTITADGAPGDQAVGVRGRSRLLDNEPRSRGNRMPTRSPCHWLRGRVTPLVTWLAT